MAMAGLELVTYHTQVPTMGQWSWSIATMKSNTLVDMDWNAIQQAVKTRWWEPSVMSGMLAMGKSSYFMPKSNGLNSK